MAANKDKLLESAQKSLKKKQVAKAIRDYAKVVELDPVDVRSRQKLAELYVRTGKNVEAYEHYEAVAKYFSSNGFYLKAIAIYKQMQRLDPSQVALSGRMAELNEKQGLIGNAMSEYRNLVGYYERNGMVADAIKVLEKMRDLDTANLNVRIKLAEVYTANERADEGLAEFEAVLADLSEKNEFDKILKLYKIILPLFPKNKKLQMGLALTLYEKGDLKKGISILSSLLQGSPQNPDILRLIARGYNDLREWDSAAETSLQLLELDPSDLDTRELLIKVYFDSNQLDQALSELEEWKEAFLKADRLEKLKNYYEVLKEKLPNNPLILQTLDSIYELTGEGDKLLDILSEKEESAETTDDETLSDSLLGSVIDDIEVPSIDLELSQEEEEAIVDLPVEEELDLQLEAMDEIAITLDQEDAAAADKLMELDLRDDTDLGSQDTTDLEYSFEMDNVDEESLEPAVAERDIAADLEEAEFYIQQGLYVEAEKLCSDVLAFAPDSEECQQKLTEIRQYLHKKTEEPVAESTDLPAELSTESFPEFPAVAESVDVLTDKTDKQQKVFRTDVDEQIAADDMESHYNLGIAYREMGLLDDAVSEFTKAEKDTSRYVDCQTLKGLCYSEKGEFDSAELVFQQALDSPHLEEEQRLSLGYELAGLYGSAERLEDALSCYQSVMEQDQNYRDIREKIAALQERLGIVSDSDAGMMEESKERISFI
ncbi:MAG: tetratricopeptide repeat protein [Desulfuromonadales bacterium]|nr:tetratricopeptide repeat protein [Desulfuromonadales bacterium]